MMKISEAVLMRATEAEVATLQRLEETHADLQAAILHRQSISSSPELTEHTSTLSGNLTGFSSSPSTPRRGRSIRCLSQLLTPRRRGSVRHRATPIPSIPTNRCSLSPRTYSPRIRWQGEPRASEASVRAHRVKSYVVIDFLKCQRGPDVGRSSSSSVTIKPSSRSPLKVESSQSTKVVAKVEPLQSTKVVAKSEEAYLAQLLDHCTPSQIARYHAAKIEPNQCHKWDIVKSCNDCRSLKLPCLSRIVGTMPTFDSQKNDNCIRCFLRRRCCDDDVKKRTRRLQEEVVTIEDLAEVNSLKRL